jgi:hypothetical protein
MPKTSMNLVWIKKLKNHISTMPICSKDQHCKKAHLGPNWKMEIEFEINHYLSIYNYVVKTSRAFFFGVTKSCFVP